MVKLYLIFPDFIVYCQAQLQLSLIMGFSLQVLLIFWSLQEPNKDFYNKNKNEV